MIHAYKRDVVSCEHNLGKEGQNIKNKLTCRSFRASCQSLMKALIWKRVNFKSSEDFEFAWCNHKEILNNMRSSALLFCSRTPMLP